MKKVWFEAEIARNLSGNTPEKCLYDVFIIFLSPQSLLAEMCCHFLDQREIYGEHPLFPVNSLSVGANNNLMHIKPVNIAVGGNFLFIMHRIG